MIPESQSLEEALFDLAEQKPDAAERAAFLDGVCRDNPALRARLEVLLEGHFGAANFLTRRSKSRAGAGPDTPPWGPPSPVEADAGEPSAGNCAPRIGRYQLLEKIGEGGFGEVWMAEQREPMHRRVALKILKLGMDSRQVVARFEAERQALALMDHPGIAQVFDAGLTETGRPYFVMELVRGTRITDYCDRAALPTHERLELFILVCQAIQHAHQKGIIHRDIKPSNILVTSPDGLAARGTPKVIDFGIAKATQGELADHTILTQVQQFMGTPAYVSPEQAGRGGADVDTRSDVYSLGVLLYELLVGQTPFDAREMLKGGLDSMRQTIREKEPARPSTRFRTLPAAELTTAAQRRQIDPGKLTQQVRGDLDWIVMKCLEKNSAHRYESASALAMDIRRYLDNEPVVARPPSTAYQLGKAIRRNRLAFTAAALVLLVLAVGASAVIYVQHRANEDYRQRLYVSAIRLADAAWQAGQSQDMRALLDRCPTALRHWEWDFLNQQADRWEQSTVIFGTNFTVADLSRSGRLLAVGAGQVTQIREFPTGRWLHDLPVPVDWPAKFVVSPRDETLAGVDGKSGKISVWNMRTGERVTEISHGAWPFGLAWSADGERLATGSEDGAIRLWDARTGREQGHFAIPRRVFALAFAPDGQTLAVGLDDGRALWLDLPEGRVRRTFRTRGQQVHLLKFSPDGRKLAVGSISGDARDDRVWSLEEEGSLDLVTGGVTSFAFSPDSQQLLVADLAGRIRIWDLGQGAELERFFAQALTARPLPEGRIFSMGRDGQVRLWQARRSGVMQFRGYPDALRTLSFSPDGRWLVAAGLHTNAFIWNVPEARLAGVFTNHLHEAVLVAAFSPAGNVASTGNDRHLQVWNPLSHATIWEASLAPAAEAYWLAFAPDGRRLYVENHLDEIGIFDAATGERVKTITGFDHVLDGLAISPDSRLLAVCQKRKLSLWQADGSRQLWQAPGNPERSAAFSPDGKWIATGDGDGKVSLWEVAAEGRVRRTLSGHAAAVTGVSFHPDGRRLATSSFDGQVKVWDWKSGVELLGLRMPRGGVAWHVAFSPDGKTIAAAGGDGVVTVWKTE
jgi:WD40 repeat protein/serine/threonine protein kinase